MYRNLRAAYARLNALAARGGWAPVPAGPTLKPGASDPRVLALRTRLIADGDLAGAAAPDPLSYDAALEAAVKAFQARHGLDTDGSVGPGTLAALNVPIDARIRTLRVNLERGRWLLNDLEPTFVVVNVAGYRVNYIRDGQLVWSARAQVGKAYRATPIFRSRLTYLVLNPTWTVPPSILENDILPAQRRDPSTLARKGLEVIDAQGRRVPESSVDWANATPRNFRYMLRQPPGPDNALGRVKFMFPNSYSVYLHDTPSRNLFEKSDRAFSSGCIRVEDPLRLAELLLQGQRPWNRVAIDSVIQAGKTRNVTLAHAIPVLLSYWTAWVDRDGTLQLRPDIYGRDMKVAAGLEMPFGFRRRSP
jgi:murein L,D-transpeptidase YcbB/YkuD